jgi:rhodanese-related sulfurtransferase
LFDPLLGQRLLSYAELVRMWDGVGVLVAAKPADARSLLAARRTRLVLYGVMALAGIGLVHWITATRLRGAAPRSRKGLAGLSAVQAGGLLVAASLAGVSCHFVDAEGFLSHANATASVQQAYMGSFLPKIEASDVRRLTGGNAVFVDARYPGDYRAGHLDGAINIPVNATEVQRREALRRVNKDSRIVLYCQSAGCKFAETVAIKLVSDGFANVAIFTGGWQDWQSVNSKPRG